MANTSFIIKRILMIFLILILIVMLILFCQAVFGISKNQYREHYTNVAITTALVAANAILGLVGTHREHFLFVVVFAILQTVLIIFGWAIPTRAASSRVESWFSIPLIGSAILAFVFAYSIKSGHTV